MTENTLTLDTTDATVKAVIKDGKTGRIVYRNYVTKFEITTKEHVSEHVAALVEAAGFKADEKADRKRFAMRVRAGLNYYLPTDENADETETPVYVLTAQGVKSLKDMSDEDVLKAVRAEIAAR